MDEKQKEEKDDNVVKLKPKKKKGKEQTLDVQNGNLGAKRKF